MKLLKFGFWMTGAYVLVIGLAFAWSMAVVKFPNLRALHDEVFGLAVGFNFSQASAIVSQDLTYNGSLVPRDPRFSPKDVSSVDELDRIVFLLDGLGSARDNEIMQVLGIDVDMVAEFEGSDTMHLDAMSVGYRLHILPITISRKDHVYVDQNWLVENYREECHIRIVQNFGAREEDNKFRQSCKIN